MLRINRLTPAQEARLPEYRDKWLKIGLSTEPLDFEAAKKAVVKIYAAAGLQPPTVYYRMSSPLGCVVLATQLKSAQVGAQVRDQVWAQVSAQVGAQVGVQVGVQVGAQASGSHDAAWLSFYDFCLREFNLEYVRPLEGLIELAMHCGWWAPYKNAVILQDRHSILRRDSQHRLHCEDGLACGYPDGWGVYAWHGVRVPEQVIMRPETITVEQIRSESNVEMRRVMIERYSLDRYIDDSGAKIIHSSGDRILYKAELPNDEPIVTVRVLNSTPEPDGSIKSYFIRVPPGITDADAAVAWTFGMDKATYCPQVET